VRHVSAFIFKGYWEDIGTIRAFTRQTWILLIWCRNTVFLSPTRRSTRTRVFYRAAKLMAQRCDRRLSLTAASSRTRIWNAPSLGYAALFRAEPPFATAS